MSWHEALPATYRWLESLSLKSIDCLTNDHVCIVAVKPEGNGKTGFTIETKFLDDGLKQQLVQAATSIGWLGKSGAQTVVVGPQKFVLVSLSKIKTSAPQKSRQAGIDCVSELKGRMYKHLAICEGQELSAIDCFEGIGLGWFESQAFKGKKEEENFPESIGILGQQISPSELKNRLAIMKGITMARLVQDAPPNWLDPDMFAEFAQGICQQFEIKCRILGRREMEEKKMGSFLSVAGGSLKDPKMIIMEIEGEDTSRTKLMIGKGLTFDSGGISLKPGSGMDEMKYDMSGGAAVLGVARALAEIKPKTNVVCLIGAVENMPGHHATRPGDIVQAYNGKTIEVLNTDAEGRLVLADCLAYGIDAYKPELVIDAATLTGAVLQGLGSAGAAVVSNDQDLADHLVALGCKIGEPYWHMPMWPELDKEVKGEVGDLKNIANPSVKAGTLIGGVFLREFVGATKWAHLDIAGTAWNCRATGFPSTGGSGFGLRLMLAECLEE
jgi:leucyl aminopeptidase